MDDVILPGDGEMYDLSSGVCTAVGAIASFLLVFVSYKASKFSAKLDRDLQLAKIAFEDFFNLFVLAATTMYWRGLWNLIETHLLPASRHGKELGAWVCHVVGLVGLLAGLSFGSCFDNGVCLDGDQLEGHGIRPSYNLLRYMCLDRHTTAKVGPR